MKPGRGVGIRTNGSYTASAEDPEDTSDDTQEEEPDEETEKEEDSGAEEEQPDASWSVPEEPSDASSGRMNLFLLLGLLPLRLSSQEIQCHKRDDQNRKNNQ